MAQGLKRQIHQRSLLYTHYVRNIYNVKTVVVVVELPQAPEDDPQKR